MATISDLRARYENLDGPISSGDDVSTMEKRLGLALPEDMREISRFYQGGMLGGISHFTWAAAGSYSVVEKTLAARGALDLSAPFIFLAEPAESAIVWRAEQTPAIVWCHAFDFERVASGLPATADVTEFETYRDFFEFLLKQEEEERDEAS